MWDEWSTLTTHRDRSLGHEATTFFQHEAIIAAASIFFFRITVRVNREPRLVACLFAAVLAGLSYLRKSYKLISAVEIFSYAISWWIVTQKKPCTFSSFLVRLVALFVCAVGSFLLAHLLFSPAAEILVPDTVFQVLDRVFPLHEMTKAYRITRTFLDPRILNQQLGHLLFVTFHIQVGMGYLGIGFLQEEQSRRNQLIRLDVEEPQDSSSVQANGKTKNDIQNTTSCGPDRAARFQRGAAPFILFVAMPYMFQIILFGNTNMFSFKCVEHELHRAVRLNQVFDDHNNLAALAADSATSPESKYAPFKS